MKKLLLFVIGLILITVGSAQAARTTGAISADTLLYTGQGCLYSVIVKADGTNAASVTIYDNTSGSGKALRSFTVAAGDNQAGETKSTCTIPFHTGLYIDVGTNTTVYVDWEATQ